MSRHLYGVCSIPSSSRSLQGDHLRLHALVRSLTDRDRAIVRLLDAHSVLTIHQLQDVFFDSPRSARQRLTSLYRMDVVDRFRPGSEGGSAPFHYVVGSLGALVRGLERGEELQDIRRDSAGLRMAYSMKLNHLVAVNGFFTALLGCQRRDEGELVDWWSERRCAKAMGGLVIPDGYAIWRARNRSVEFCLELDRGTETLARVAKKLDGYCKLEAVSGVRRWVLFVLPTTRREAEVRRVLADTDVAVATALSNECPADSIWMPIAMDKRMHLSDLARENIAR